MHSTLLERLGGIVDVNGNLEVLMIYSSFNHALDSAMIWAYGPEAQAIAVGSTIGVDATPQFAPLNWEEFSRDLLVAHHFSHIVGVYSLEGCIQQGFLHRLTTMNWDQTVVIPGETVRKALLLRARIQRVIWIVSHLPYFAGVLLILIGWIIVRWRRRTRPLRPEPSAPGL